MYRFSGDATLGWLVFLQIQENGPVLPDLACVFSRFVLWLKVIYVFRVAPEVSSPPDRDRFFLDPLVPGGNRVRGGRPRLWPYVTA